MRVRPEQPGDYDEVDRVVEAAFRRPDEAALVRRLRALADCYVPDLALVAESDGLVGHVMLTRVTLHADDRRDVRVLQLAPLAVDPASQRTGVGKALMAGALSRADAAGAPLVLVLGHPSYYPNNGFEPAGELGIAPPVEAMRPAFFVARLSAYDRSLRGVAGPLGDGVA